MALGTKRLFNVGDAVLAKVDGFAPFPAVVQSVRLNGKEGSQSSVFYYVRFQGSLEIVPLNGENLEPLTENHHKSKLKYNDKDFKRESKLRVDAVLGAEDEIPDVLMNFVTVDSDFEEVSDDVVNALGLVSIKLTPSMIQRLEKASGAFTEEDEFVDVEDIQEDELAPLSPKDSHSCPSCQRIYKSAKALKCHVQRSVLCRKLGLRHTAFPQRAKSCKKKPVNVLASEDPNRKWASRSASGYYPCKLCFRKFKSIGEAQLHMSSHKPHARHGVPKIQRASAGVPEVSEGSNSTDEDEEAKSLKHNVLERERRAELAAKFNVLQLAIGLEGTAAKVKILETAKCLIRELQEEAEQLDQHLSSLEEQNQELRAKYLLLKRN